MSLHDPLGVRPMFAIPTLSLALFCSLLRSFALLRSFVLFCGFALALFWPSPSLQKCVGDFCCIRFGGFAGDFLGGFFWALFFPHKNEEKKSGERIHKRIRWLKNKNLVCVFLRTTAFGNFQIPTGGSPKKFSLCASRSSSENFLIFSREISREIWREFCGTHKIKVQTLGGNFQNIFRKKFVTQKKDWASFALQMCHPNKKGRPE